MPSGIVGIDHIAVVTGNLSKAQRFYRKLGLQTTKVSSVTEQFPEEPKPHLYRAFAVLFSDRGPTIWITEPQGKSGPLKRFLSRQGPGPHDIGRRVKLAEREEVRVRKRGIRLARSSMRDGREKRSIIDPHDSEGVLLELVQRFPKS